MTEPVTGIILAGGQSRRMGQDKAFLEFDGQPLIVRICERLRPVCDELLVVTNDAGKFAAVTAVIVEDLVPGAHALGGLYTGLMRATHDACFVTACDAPFLNPALIQCLLHAAGGYDAVIPRTAQGLQPLHAVYRRTCLPAIERQLRNQRWDLQSLASSVHAHIIDPEVIHRFDPAERSCWNLNTPADYAQARHLVPHHDGSHTN